jgi:hypothetical protein
MANNDAELDRLLRAAAAASANDDSPIEAPYGFDTRVVAAWRSYRSREGGDASEFARFFRRLAACAVVIAALASAGAVWQLQQNDDLDEATGGAYAMADSLIEASAWQ